jgi:hypothetical protein
MCEDMRATVRGIGPGQWSVGVVGGGSWDVGCVMRDLMRVTVRGIGPGDAEVRDA